jgi:hypothetical protein
MWWFRTSNQKTMTARLRERRSAVEILKRNITMYRLVPTQVRVTTAAYHLTCTEEDTFTAAFGEAMPHHLITALHLERDLWLAIHDTLEHATRADYVSIVPSLRHDLATLARLLALEEEMHESPLTISFQRRLATVGSP